MKFSVFVTLGACLGLAACQPANESVEPAEQVSMSSPGPTPELGDWGVDLSSRDISINPGDDFFRYANGRWLEEFEIPPDRSNHGAFIALRDRSDDRVRTIIEDLVSSEPAHGSVEQKIADYYRSYMDTDTLNELGIQPLHPRLVAIEAIEDVADLTEAFGRSSIDTTSSPLDFGVSPDRVNPDRYQLGVYVTGISLPDRDYYLQDNERFASVRDAFRQHIVTTLDFAEFNDSEAMADAVLELETQIATHLWPRAERRNRDLTYNPMSYDEFKAAYSAFDWDAFFSAAGVDNLEDLNVSYPSAMSPIIELVNDAPLESWKSWLSYKLISNNASILSEEIDNENFRFYGTILNGIPQQRERWERGVARVGALNSLGEALGQVYVNNYFPESAKQQMEELVENLRTALAESIDENDWMDEATKQEARLKLNSFRPKIAYPDEWKDLSSIEISRGDLLANARNVREFFYDETISRIGEQTDREEWGMTPQTVNAYYNSSFNEIVFPAGILQAPFFDPAADSAVNYGGIGSVIGHEMGHGFDDQGSKSDSLGIQRNWWTESVRAAFDDLTASLANQYDAYEPVPGQFIDGRFTLGENIGDVGGLSMAYRAYRIALNGEEAAVIDGLTGDQRFFLAWAQVWQSKIREDALVSRLTSDPHSPAEYRVNGVVRNHDAWYEAFDVQPGDALYLPPEERVRIW
ncbi:MAG: M13 family metallopeptidase [Pseudohongiellaceae bacterium]